MGYLFVSTSEEILLLGKWEIFAHLTSLSASLLDILLGETLGQWKRDLQKEARGLQLSGFTRAVVYSLQAVLPLLQLGLSSDLGLITLLPAPSFLYSMELLEKS